MTDPTAPGRYERCLIRAELVDLAYELLDAHADTVDLACTLDTLPWRAHLDYLRALQRKGKELLAGTAPNVEAHWKHGAIP